MGDKTPVENGYWDGTAQAVVPKLFDAQSGEELLTFKVHKELVFCVAYCPDGKRLVSQSDKAIRIWDAQTGEELFSFAWIRGVRNLAFNPEGTRLAAPSGDGTVKVFDIAARQASPMFRALNLAMSPDGKRVAGAYGGGRPVRDRAIKLWDSQTGQEILSIQQPEASNENSAFNRNFVLAISPDGKLLAAGFGTRDTSNGRWIAGEVKVWDAQTGREIVTFKEHSTSVLSVAFSPDSTRVVSSGSENAWGQPGVGEVKVWNALTGQELLTLQGHKRFVDSVIYAPEGNRLATLSRDNSVKVWDAETGRELLNLTVQSPRSGSCVAFSPDGKRLASSNDPGQIKLFSVETGEELLTLRGHSGIVGSIAFSPDGRRLVSGAPFGEMKLWDAQTGEELLNFEGEGGYGIYFSPDGHRLAATANEGLKIYDATPLPEKP